MKGHVCYEQVISIKYGSYWDRKHFGFVSIVNESLTNVAARCEVYVVLKLSLV